MIGSDSIVVGLSIYSEGSALVYVWPNQTIYLFLK